MRTLACTVVAIAGCTPPSREMPVAHVATRAACVGTVAVRETNDGLVELVAAAGVDPGVESTAQREWSADLDGDGLLDVVVSDTSGGNRGENRHAVLRGCADGRFMPVLATDYVDGALVATHTRTAGWRDLQLVDGEPARAKVIGGYAFDGSQYRSR